MICFGEILVRSTESGAGGERGPCRRRAGRWAKWAMASLLPLLASACAGAPRDVSMPVRDPHEEINRQVMATNLHVLRPVSEVVKATVPAPVHDRVHDFNSNLKEPRIFVNNVLQFRLDAAARTAARFALNSTFGIGGLFDIANREGLPPESGDFGQTLFVWGVGEGPYVVRPYLGPSTLRDAVGSTVDMVGNPLGWLIGTQLAVTIGTTALDAVDRLGELKAAEDASIDFYSFIRSSYYQMRRNELREAIGLPSAVDSPATDDLEEIVVDAGALASASQ
jgi:phospholipid-binding lipoprotein MlaA